MQPHRKHSSWYIAASASLVAAAAVLGVGAGFISRRRRKRGSIMEYIVKHNAQGF